MGPLPNGLNGLQMLLSSTSRKLGVYLMMGIARISLPCEGTWSWIPSWFWILRSNFKTYNQKNYPPGMLTYPTLGKVKSSSNVPLGGDMLVAWRVSLRATPPHPVIITNEEGYCYWVPRYFYHQHFVSCVVPSFFNESARKWIIFRGGR